MNRYDTQVVIDGCACIVSVLSAVYVVQMAAKAQRASVEPAEVVRYEEYDSKHGARYVDNDAAAADMDEEW